MEWVRRVKGFFVGEVRPQTPRVCANCPTDSQTRRAWLGPGAFELLAAGFGLAVARSSMKRICATGKHAAASRSFSKRRYTGLHVSQLRACRTPKNVVLMTRRAPQHRRHRVKRTAGPTSPGSRSRRTCRNLCCRMLDMEGAVVFRQGEPLITSLMSCSEDIYSHQHTWKA